MTNEMERTIAKYNPVIFGREPSMLLRTKVQGWREDDNKMDEGHD